MAYSFRISENESDLNVFKVVDLGCGSGVALSAMVLFRMLLLSLGGGGDDVCGSRRLKFEGLGIDLYRSKIEECVETNKLLLARLSDDLKLRGNAGDISNPIDSLVRLVVLEDNFLDISDKWVDSDVVIICGTCFQSDVLHPIYAKCRLLKAGSIVVVVDQIHLHDDSSPDSYAPHFKLVGSCEATSSWGVGCVYFYVKI
jgi:SAM-dependent methyltransferase